MGARVRETGGGAAAPVAQGFNQFLMQQLQQPRQAQPAPFANPSGYNNPAVQGGINQQQSNQAQPFQQTATRMMQAPGSGYATPTYDGAMPQGPGPGGPAQMYSGLQSNQDFMSGMDANDPRMGTPEFQQYMGARQNAVQSQGQAPQMSAGGQPQQTGFQQAFGNQLSGQVNDISGANSALQNFFGNPSQNNIPTNFGNTFASPQYQSAQTSQLPTNFGAGQTGMANLGQFGNAAQSNFNSQGPINSQFTSQLQGLIGQGQQQAQNGVQMGGNGGFAAASAGPGVALQGGMDYRQAFDTLGQDPLLARNQQRAVADMRARFGAEGAGSLGTGAQFAEGNLNAELMAQDASARRGQAMQLMGQDLNERSTGANVGLQSRGQDVQTGIANMQGGLQGAQNQIAGYNAQTNSLGQLMNAAGQGRGQDMQTMLGQLGLGNQQSMFNAGQSNDMQGQMINATLQNQGMGNQFGLGAAGLNNNAMQTNNANNINQSQFQNNFNQGNANSSAQYGLGANQLNSQNQNFNNQMLQAMTGMGLNLNQMGNQNVQQMIQNLFGGFGQSNALGTAQRETTVTPNPWMQGAQMGTDILTSIINRGQQGG